MAVSSPNEILKCESTCSICFDFFTDPVALGCGHNFCRDCIKQCLKEPEIGSICCPQCRQICLWDKITPNRLLVSVVEAAKQMKVEMKVAQAAQLQVGSLCARHHEELKLYCHDDEELICTVCDRSRKHRDHFVLPVEEAAEDYKISFQHKLVDLKIKFEDLVTCRRSDEELVTYLKNEIETQKSLLKSEMENLHKLLHEQEEILLCKLVAAETSLSMIDTNIITKSSEKIDRLNELILKIEASRQQPANEIMKDAKDFLARIYEELHEECNLTVVQCKPEVVMDKDVDPICPSDTSEEDTAEEERNPPKPKKNTFFTRMRRILQLSSSSSHRQQTPDDTNYSHAVGKKPKAKVLYDYKGGDDDDLSFVEGDIITDIVEITENWWYGVCKGKFGMFPANYVTRL